jgi:hypothetical protein
MLVKVGRVPESTVTADGTEQMNIENKGHLVDGSTIDLLQCYIQVWQRDKYDINHIAKL